MSVDGSLAAQSGASGGQSTFHTRGYSEPAGISSKSMAEVSQLRQQLMKEQQLRLQKEEELEVLQMSLHERSSHFGSSMYPRVVSGTAYDADSGITSRGRSMLRFSDDPSGSRHMFELSRTEPRSNGSSVHRSRHTQNLYDPLPSRFSHSAYDSSPIRTSNLQNQDVPNWTSPIRTTDFQTPSRSVHSSPIPRTSHMSSTHTPLHDGILHSSPSLPRRAVLNLNEEPSTWTPGVRFSEKTVMELKEALKESENRRIILMGKLKEAQDTLEIQTERLSKLEGTVKENSFEVDDMRFKERDYQRRIQELEKEKETQKTLRAESFHFREKMQNKLDHLETEHTSLHAHHNILLSEQKQTKEVLDKTSNALVLLEEENAKLSKNKDAITKELSALKGSLEIARKRNEKLENEMQDSRQEISRLREENMKLVSDGDSLRTQLTEMKQANAEMKDENNRLIVNLKRMGEENVQLKSHLADSEESLADVKSKLVSVNSDKERYFQEKLDLHQRVQQLSHDKEHLYKTKVSVEEQLSELHADIAHTKLQADRKQEELRQLEDELNAVKKVSKDLSTELASAKANLEKSQEKLGTTENAKHVAMEQQSFFEQENRSLQIEVEGLKRQLESTKRDYSQEKNMVDEYNQKLKEDMRKVKADKNQLEIRCHELETKLRKANEELKDGTNTHQDEIETWKNTCERLTGSMSRKEAEVQMYMQKIQHLEEQSSHFKLEHQKQRVQFEELIDAKEELERLQEENRRLLQERAENQQVIQLLEMQKNILSKNKEAPSQSEVSRNHVHELEQLRVRWEHTSNENTELRKKIDELEQIRDDLIREKEKKLKTADLFLEEPNPGSLEARKEELERQNQQLRDVNNMVTEQLTKLESENANLKETLSTNGAKKELDRLTEEFDQLKTDHANMQQEYSVLEKKHHQLLGQGNISGDGDSSSADVRALQKEKEGLLSQLNLVQGQVVLAENSKKRAEDRVQRLERDIKDLRKTASEKFEDEAKIDSMQREIYRLKSELEEAKSEQELTQEQEAVRITTLKSEIQEMQKDLEAAQSKIQGLKSDISAMKSQLEQSKTDTDSAQNEVKRLTSDFNISQDNLTQAQKELSQLKVELEESQNVQSKQEAVINSLKDELNDVKLKKSRRLSQSLDDVGAELIHVKTELHKLLEVIQVKDHEIEGLEKQLKEAKDELDVAMNRKNSEGDVTTATPKSSPSRVENLAKQLKSVKAHTTKRGPAIENLKSEISKLKQQPLSTDGALLNGKDAIEEENLVCQKQQNTTLMKELEAVKHRYLDVSTKLDIVTKAKKQMEKKLDEIQQKYETKESEKAHLTDQVQEKNKLLSDLEDQLSKALKEITSLQEDNSFMEAENELLLSQLKEYKIELSKESPKENSKSHPSPNIKQYVKNQDGHQKISVKNGNLEICRKSPFSSPKTTPNSTKPVSSEVVKTIAGYLESRELNQINSWMKNKGSTINKIDRIDSLELPPETKNVHTESLSPSESIKGSHQQVPGIQTKASSSKSNSQHQTLPSNLSIVKSLTAKSVTNSSPGIHTLNNESPRAKSSITTSPEVKSPRSKSQISISPATKPVSKTQEKPLLAVSGAFTNSHLDKSMHSNSTESLVAKSWEEQSPINSKDYNVPEDHFMHDSPKFVPSYSKNPVIMITGISGDSGQSLSSSSSKSVRLSPAFQRQKDQLESPARKRLFSDGMLQVPRRSTLSTIKEKQNKSKIPKAFSPRKEKERHKGEADLDCVKRYKSLPNLNLGKKITTCVQTSS